MKKIYKYISLVLLLTLTQSCEDFLTYKSKDMIVPSELAHFEQLIFGEVIKLDAETAMRMLDMMSDDAQDTVGTDLSTWDVDQRISMSGWYSWSKEPQTDFSGTDYEDKSWLFLYHKIVMCNIIEDEVKNFPASGYSNRLIGEVQFMRALSYFYLVNMYGVPYIDAEQAKTALGVPINNELSIRKYAYKRNKLQEVYNLIDKNLISANNLLSEGDGKSTVFRPSADAAKLLLSRSYLFQKRYRESIEIASDLIQTSKAGVTPISFMKDEASKTGVFYLASNPGIIFSWCKANQTPLFNYAGYKVSYTVSNSLLDLFHPKDTRIKGFFSVTSSGARPDKCDGYANNIYSRGFRIEEAYLIRAEAYAETNNLQGALDDINILRGNRIDSPDFKRASSDKSQVVQYVRDERRLEMCFEELRWFDMRRWQLEATHTYTNKANNKMKDYYRLRGDSPNYTMPIPFSETRINSEIERIERVDSKIN